MSRNRVVRQLTLQSFVMEPRAFSIHVVLYTNQPVGGGIDTDNADFVATEYDEFQQRQQHQEERNINTDTTSANLQIPSPSDSTLKLANPKQQAMTRTRLVNRVSLGWLATQRPRR